jgi:hypothetical protein
MPMPPPTSRTPHPHSPAPPSPRPSEPWPLPQAEGLSASALMSILSTAEIETFEGLMPPTRNGERPDFIRRIEPLWGKGALYEERFIGAWMASEDEYKDCSPGELMEKQGQLQEIYEGRIASMERLVSFMVMFHAMAKRVQDFWPRVSCGLLGYDMSRSQSIMRIGTPTWVSNPRRIDARSICYAHAWAPCRDSHDGLARLGLGRAAQDDRARRGDGADVLCQAARQELLRAPHAPRIEVRAGGADAPGAPSPDGSPISRHLHCISPCLPTADARG